MAPFTIVPDLLVVCLWYPLSFGVAGAGAGAGGAEAAME